MATDSAAKRSLISELFASGMYKRNQGRLVRQLTCLSIWVTAGLAVWRLHDAVLTQIRWENYIGDASDAARSLLNLSIPVGILAIGLWAGYRVVNWPPFADFLISVQAEMNKVTWPSKPELVKASLVVIFTILFLAGILFGFDLIWRAIFQYLD